MNKILSSLLFTLFFFSTLGASETLFLRDNLMRTNPGDFIVTAQNKNYTVLLIRDKTDKTLTVEEISIPEQRFPKGQFKVWREWINAGAPGHTAWVSYTVAPYDNKMTNYYSYTQGGFCDVDSNHFLCTLLSLRFHKIPDAQRRRIGATFRHGASTEQRPFWHPRLIVDGENIPGATFTAWRTKWPQDGGDLAGKQIEVYLPDSNSPYPSYFPYWLEVSGMIGKAKVRIIDSGSSLQSPKPPIPRVR